MFLDKIKQELEKLNEVTAIRKKRIRGGKVQRKRDCPPGYTLIGGVRCVRQTAKERITRKRAGRRSARKSKSARRRNVKRSMRIRARRNIKNVKFK